MLTFLAETTACLVEKLARTVEAVLPAIQSHPHASAPAAVESGARPGHRAEATVLAIALL